MSPADPARLARFAPPTRGTVRRDRFLALGAAVGTLGWGGTVLLTAWPGLLPAPVALSVVLWGLLVSLMVGVGLFGTPDPVRFSRPMLVWGPANATATLVTLGVLFGPFPAVALPAAWALAGAFGYGVSGRVTTGVERRVYLAAAFTEVLTLGALAAGLPPVGAFVLLGVAHVVPLLLVVGTDDERAPAVVVFAWLAAFLVVRALWFA